MSIRDRVKELKRVKASELLPNPKNWRLHPESQTKALAAVVDEVGFAGAALAFETPDGLMLIDGHARRDMDPDAEIPVLVTDLTAEEAEKLLAVYDPIGELAQMDAQAFLTLSETIKSENDDLNALFETMKKDAARLMPPKEGRTDPDAIPPEPETPVTQPGDLWLLGPYWECEDCGKRYEYEEGLQMKECSCG